jgi:hypothetical protein
MFWIVASLVLAQAQPALMSYDRAVRCAGLTQAASELEGGESARGRQLSDAALFWSLAAAQAAGARGRDFQAAEAEQTLARLTAVRELSRGVASAREQLSECLSRTPDMG